MENLDIFEMVCTYFLEKISEFKEILSAKVSILENADWTYNKGTIKTCQPDATSRKMRCKAGLEYRSKVELSMYDADVIWNEFNLMHFLKKLIQQILKGFQLMKR